jgi:hypothetical protein
MTHEEARELLEAYVLGTLDAADHARVSAHLATCATCQVQVAAYQTLLAQMTQTLAQQLGTAPPPQIKTRLLTTITRATPPRLAHVWRWRGWASWAAVVLLICAFFWIVQLNVALASEQASRARLQEETELIFEVVDGQGVQRHFLRAAKAIVQEGVAPPYGKVFIRPDMLYVVAMGGRLPPPPAGEVYQLWLFTGETPHWAGTFEVDENGFASLIYTAEQIGPAYDQILVVRQAPTSPTPDGTLFLGWRKEN